MDTRRPPGCARMLGVGPRTSEEPRVTVPTQNPTPRYPTSATLPEGRGTHEREYVQEVVRARGNTCKRGHVGEEARARGGTLEREYSREEVRTRRLTCTRSTGGVM